MAKKKISQRIKKNINKEFDIDKKIVELKQNNYETLKEAHGFSTNGTIGAFNAAIDKFKYLYHVQFLLGVMSGVIVGMAYGTYLVIVAKVVNPDQEWLKLLLLGVIFPPAIWMITFVGGALFTSHVVWTIPMIKGVIKKDVYFKVLATVYAGNMSGTGLMALLIALTGAFNASGLNGTEYTNTIMGNALNIADHKLYSFGDVVRKTSISNVSAKDVLLTIMYVFFSGVLCNLCVSATLPTTFSTKSNGTAAMVMFFLVFYFAVSGYQHSPANTFFFWMYIVDAVLHGSTTSLMLGGFFILLNLIPAALGNWLSGGFLLPGVLYLTQKPYVKLLFDQIKLKQYEQQKADIGKEIVKDNIELNK